MNDASRVAFGDRAYMTSLSKHDETFDDLATWQDGVVTTRSALGFMSADALRWQLRSGRWQQPCRGIIVANSGPLTSRQELRIAVLWAGPAAVLGGITAATLQGLRGFDDKASAIHVLRPVGRGLRNTRPPLPMVVHHTRHLTAADIHPVREPPQTRMARSLVDAATWMGTDRGAEAVLAAGVQQRLIRVTDLAAEVGKNERRYRRKIIRQALGDIGGGAHALSEIDFTRLVIRPFKIPEPDRQVPRLDRLGRRRWLDAVWEKARLIVEIDGSGHIDVRGYWDDMDRDNHLTRHYRVMRFPAWVVRYQPEYVASEIRQALRDAGSPC
jgi:hypothetical protein